MQALQRYVVDDQNQLTAASQNTNRKYHGNLQNVLAPVLNSYNLYNQGRGNPHLLTPINGLSKTEKHALKLLYATEANEYAFIPIIRAQGKKSACPVCGSQSAATLDHYLPRSKYPEFSVYSWNLIPACFDCNTHRNDTYVGIGIHDRLIHPYYDNFVSRRLLSIKIDPPYWGAKLTFVPCNVSGSEEAICLWHIQNIIDKTSALDRVTAIWGNITRNKESARVIFGRHQTLRQFKKSVEKTLNARDLSYGATNNWESALFHGILRNNDVLNWIFMGCNP
jgi:hypothetical protein